MILRTEVLRSFLLGPGPTTSYWMLGGALFGPWSAPFDSTSRKSVNNPFSSVTGKPMSN